MQYTSGGTTIFEYMTAQKAAERWNVSLRWVQRLCKEECIDGALYIRRVWHIPKNDQKSVDGRCKENRKSV